jgi:hypothetical protein
MLERILKELPRIYLKSQNWLILILAGVFANALDIFDSDFKIATEQAGIATATGIWLDFWGYYFKIVRFPLESDDDFRKRIIIHLNGSMVTRQAIIESIRPYLSGEPRLTEYTGDVTVNADYMINDYDLDILRNAYLIRIEYPKEGIDQHGIYIGKHYINTKEYIRNVSINDSLDAIIRDTVNSVKMAGEKVVSKAVDRKQLVLKVNPKDFVIIKNKKDELSIYVENSNNIFLIADSTINQGSIKAETPSGYVDADIDVQIDTVLKSLLGE